MATPGVQSAVEQELALMRAMLDADPGAVERRAGEIQASWPADPRPARVRAAALKRLGRAAEADAAERASIEASLRLPNLDSAARAIKAGQLSQAEDLLRRHLDSDPEDPEALRLLAEVAARTGFLREAEGMLRNVLTAAPSFVRAYVNLASLLHPLGRADEAIALLDAALEREPEHPVVLSFKAGMLSAERRDEEALPVHEALLRLVPDQPVPWTNYAHALKAVGRAEEAVAAYRRALALDPSSGMAWWGLANLKTVRLDASDADAIGRALSSAGDGFDRVQLHFALGKALGDEGRYAESFEHYARGNALRKDRIPSQAAQVDEEVRRTIDLFTPDFVRQRETSGLDAPDPIFILGMPRSGSTLVEQILASHPLVEGAGELRELEQIVEQLAERRPAGTAWLEPLAGLAPEELRALGERYMSLVRRWRRTGGAFFTDKMPSNWRYAGLINLILPNARIIDVRRHPLGCCFSNFALYFNRETNLASGLEELAAYYSAYVRMMAHMDRLLPGRVHRVFYEDLVADPRREVKRLLDYLGLPFDEACLRFHENPRAVHTPSAMQVRRPIGSDGIDRWRDYEPWLEPLKRALGPVLELYPQVPAG